MRRIKEIIRNIIKKIYMKLNPQHKYILRIDATVGDIRERQGMLWKLDGSVEELKARVAALEAQLPSSQQDKLYLATDTRMYRYLYLLRYMKSNDRALDVEAEYGTGMDLLYKYTQLDSGLCLNSIDYYTRAGGMYYASESVRYKTGTIYDITGKFNLITFLSEARTELLTREDLQKLYGLLEFEGILAVAFKNTSFREKELEPLLREIGFAVENRLYQSSTSPELVEQEQENAAVILYLRKDDAGDHI